MEKSLFEQMRITYHREGDYLIPNLTLPEVTPIGIWGQRRQKYLQEHHNSIYTALLLGGKLNNHLLEIDQQAEEMFSQLVMQMAEQESITEQLKTDSQMVWVGRMNNIRQRAEKIVNAEWIYS